MPPLAPSLVARGARHRRVCPGACREPTESRTGLVSYYSARQPAHRAQASHGQLVKTTESTMHTPADSTFKPMWRLALNAKNLADKEHIVACFGADFCRRGDPLMVLATAQYAIQLEVTSERRNDGTADANRRCLRAMRCRKSCTAATVACFTRMSMRSRCTLTQPRCATYATRCPRRLSSTSAWPTRSLRCRGPWSTCTDARVDAHRRPCFKVQETT